MRFKNDQYRKARGGRSQLLDITCEHCGTHVCFYQKDGPGLLMRLYFDRMLDARPHSEELSCSSCRRLVGVKIVFDKEKRLAYRLFAGAVIKKPAKLSDV